MLVGVDSVELAGSSAPLSLQAWHGSRSPRQLSCQEPASRSSCVWNKRLEDTVQMSSYNFC